jgi:hypothetical protein
MMFYGALKSSIDQGRSAIIVLLHLTFPVFYLCTWIDLFVAFFQIKKLIHLIS